MLPPPTQRERNAVSNIPMILGLASCGGVGFSESVTPVPFRVSLSFKDLVPIGNQQMPQPHNIIIRSLLTPFTARTNADRAMIRNPSFSATSPLQTIVVQNSGIRSPRLLGKKCRNAVPLLLDLRLGCSLARRFRRRSYGPMCSTQEGPNRFVDEFIVKQRLEEAAIHVAVV